MLDEETVEINLKQEEGKWLARYSIQDNPGHYQAVSVIASGDSLLSCTSELGAYLQRLRESDYPLWLAEMSVSNTAYFLSQMLSVWNGQLPQKFLKTGKAVEPEGLMNYQRFYIGCQLSGLKYLSSICSSVATELLCSLTADYAKTAPAEDFYILCYEEPYKENLNDLQAFFFTGDTTDIDWNVVHEESFACDPSVTVFQKVKGEWQIIDVYIIRFNRLLRKLSGPETEAVNNSWKHRGISHLHADLPGQKDL